MLLRPPDKSLKRNQLWFIDGQDGSMEDVAKNKMHPQLFHSTSLLLSRGPFSLSRPVLSTSFLPVLILFPPLLSSFAPHPPILSCENLQPRLPHKPKESDTVCLVASLCWLAVAL